jgi:hypothetical protein
MLAEQAKQDAALREIEAGAGEASAEAFAAATSVHQAPANVTLKPRFTWRVTDLASVPERFTRRVPHEAAIEFEITQFGEKTNIPGIAVTRDMGIIGRSI